ncbi:MAG: hypothetical protein ABI230_07060 [Aestuariivirga sp.]
MTDLELSALQAAGIIDSAKCAEIARFLAEHRTAPQSDNAAPTPRFDMTHVLWYGGALIIIAAMSIFTTAAFNGMGGWALAACGLAYGVTLLWIGHTLWRRENLRVPAGLLIASAVSMVPLTIFGIQHALGLFDSVGGDPGQYHGFYDWVKAGWIYMELGTIIAALLAIWRYRFPFILLIGGIALWFMSMDLAMWFTSTPLAYDDYETRRSISVFFGLAMIIAAWAWDVIKGRRPDMMFWIHIFGIMAFWGGLTMNEGGTELQNFMYCLLNIGLLGFSLFIDRRVYTLFGVLGIMTYLGYLASDVFKDMIVFSFALSAIGLAIIFVGLWLNKNRARMAQQLEQSLPPFLKKLRPADVS